MHDVQLSHNPGNAIADLKLWRGMQRPRFMHMGLTGSEGFRPTAGRSISQLVETEDSAGRYAGCSKLSPTLVTFFDILVSLQLALSLEPMRLGGNKRVQISLTLASKMWLFSAYH